MSNHIPGPWVYESKEERDLAAQVCDGERCGWVKITTASGTIIGSTYMHNEAMNEANARLIAAAPDLLAAIECLIEDAQPDNWDDDDDAERFEAWKQAFRAICKANGVPVPANMEAAPCPTP